MPDNKIAALVLNNNLTPSTAKRIYALKVQGLNMDIYPGIYRPFFMKNWLLKILFLTINFPLRLFQVLTIYSKKEYRIVILHRKFYEVPLLFKAMVTFLKKRKKIVFDFDDALYCQWWDFGATPWIVKKADFVFAGSHRLIEYSKPLNQHVAHIPTAIDLFAIPGKDPLGEGPFVLGWWGSAPVNRENLLMIRPIIYELLRRNPHFLFRLVGTQGDKEVENIFTYGEAGIDTRIILMDRVPFEKRAEVLCGFDVGLMPVRDTEFDRGRSGGKLIDYLSFGIPSIASDVGEARHILRHGQNGFLATKEEEWIRFAELLSKTPSLRDSISKGARKTVETDYDLRKIKTRIQTLLDSLS